MAKVVNDPSNLPVTIIVSELEKFEKHGITEDFLKALAKIPSHKIAKETDKYFIVSTNVMLRFRFPKYLNAFRLLRRLMDECWLRNIQYIMINKK
jgi:hypothetical protein